MDGGGAPNDPCVADRLLATILRWVDARGDRGGYARRSGIAAADRRGRLRAGGHRWSYDASAGRCRIVAPTIRRSCSVRAPDPSLLLSG